MGTLEEQGITFLFYGKRNENRQFGTAFFVHHRVNIPAGRRKNHSEIHKHMNSIWNKEEFPKEWKELIVVPIYQKGDIADCSNYRSISLLCTAYKILYSILLSRLTPHAKEIIWDHQCGFRRNRSATDHILCIPQILGKNGNTLRQCHSYFRLQERLRFT